MSRKANKQFVDEHKKTNFWFGFALGATTASTALVLLGTKKGRETLKRALELSEGLEETLFENAKDLSHEILDETKDYLAPKLQKSFTALEKPKGKLETILEIVRRLGTKYS